MTVARSEHPTIIDLTRDTPPLDDFEPIILDYNNGGLDTCRPSEKQDKGFRRKRKKYGNVEDGELLESSMPASRSHSRNREASNTKTVSKYGIGSEQRREGKHRRRHNQSREQSPRRSHSPVTHLPPPDTFFFVDFKPAPPILLKGKSPKPEPSDSEVDGICKLLLPAHVSVFGSADRPVPVEILPPSSPHPDDNYIQYLDYNDSKVPGLVRYFDETADDTKPPTRFMCKNCGLEGEHKTSECPVKICLTCGARDEHSTRSCPISKTCFACGMKGHINRTCPNRYAAGTKGIGEYNDCDRCGSEMHKTNECPTLWRIYEYLADNDRENTFRLREEKRKLGFGKGGEGYIAPEEWCYNCGDCGHLGDDCDQVPHVFDIPGEPSAFSEYNTTSGPFDLNEFKPPPSRRRELRDWERDSSRGFDASVNVGREGRKKERARMEEKAKQQERNNDPDDWFGNPKNRSSHRGGGAAKKLNLVVKDAGRQFQPPLSVPHQDQRHTDSLWNRLGGDRDRGKSEYQDRSRDRQDHYNSFKRRSSGRKEGDRYESTRESSNSGPRYKGTYSR